MGAYEMGGTLDNVTTYATYAGLNQHNCLPIIINVRTNNLSPLHVEVVTLNKDTKL